MQLLLGLNLAVVLDADVLVGGQSVNLVFRERGTVVVSLRAAFDGDDGVIREALDELELVLDLAALVGDLLLSAVPCQFHCAVQVYHVSELTTPAGRRWHHP